MKKYKITKETILKYQMKDEFPEVFKKELVVGKWYSVERTRFYDPKKALILYDEKDSLCGFDHSGKYTNYYGNPKNDGYIITEATPQEVETALIMECKKLGLVDGVHYTSPNRMFERVIVYPLRLTDNRTLVDNELNFIFYDGIFAKLIETITIQEAEKLLNKKIVGQ